MKDMKTIIAKNFNIDNIKHSFPQCLVLIGCCPFLL